MAAAATRTAAAAAAAAAAARGLVPTAARRTAATAAMPAAARPSTAPAPASLPAADSRANVLDLSNDELTDAVKALGLEPYRARQLWHWVYQRGVNDFAAMTTIGAVTRARLRDHFRIDDGRIVDHRASADGTLKWVVRYSNAKANVETVFIPEVDRGTACLSSQGAHGVCRRAWRGCRGRLRRRSGGAVRCCLARARLQSDAA